MKYHPTPEILNNYADVLVNFALNKGHGLKKGEVVLIQVPESAKPILLPLQNTVLRAGGHPLIQYIPDGINKDFFANASPEQVNFFPAAFYKGRIDQIDHSIFILAETDLHELEGVDAKMIMQRSIAMKPYMDWRNEKENQGKFSWTLGMYATPAMAKEANLSLQECWQQIISACYLDTPNPIDSWKNAQQQIELIKAKLNKLPLSQLHLVSDKTDLIVGIDQNRRWLGGDGCNIPSFEVFISPDCRRTEGHIFFDQPLYRHGNLVKNISLEFSVGKVVKFHADEGENVLREMLQVENADKIGEFSLTDKRLSNINKFMAETLFDENFGGQWGNTHLALGASFHESFPGKPDSLSKNQWHTMGFNDSAIHCDIISTQTRTVTATTFDNEEIVIYKDGQFCL